jgi:hypothetical protein
MAMFFRCQLPIEFENATYAELPQGVLWNDTFPRNTELDAWDSCLRYSDENKTEKVYCDGHYVYDKTKYQSSAFMDVSSD